MYIKRDHFKRDKPSYLKVSNCDKPESNWIKY